MLVKIRMVLHYGRNVYDAKFCFTRAGTEPSSGVLSVEMPELWNFIARGWGYATGV